MAMLTTWHPFRELARVQEEMNRALGDERLWRSGESVGWTPSCDIYEDGDEIVVRAELAGVDPKDSSGAEPVVARGERSPQAP